MSTPIKLLVTTAFVNSGEFQISAFANGRNKYKKMKQTICMFSFQEKLATLSHIVTMADFAMAMKKKLADINLHSFNDFKMKIGKCKIGILKSINDRRCRNVLGSTGKQSY